MKKDLKKVIALNFHCNREWANDILFRTCQDKLFFLYLSLVLYWIAAPRSLSGTLGEESPDTSFALCKGGR